MNPNSDLLPQAEALSDRLVAWRRDLHRHPELSFQEQRTAGIIAQHLAGLGLEVQTGIGRTGVVGVLEGDTDGPTVMLRFDMDALPIEELTGLSFASQTPGTMHACGHDGHVAIGLGVATLLADRQHNLAGRVKFVFQPAEEIGRGARAMIDDGVLQKPAPDVAFGLHLWSLEPVGWALIKAGPMWASADRFDVEIMGRGAHGGMPQAGVDAVSVAAFAITQLQTVISRHRDPLQPAVLTVGTIQGGSAYNVIAERVHFSGTLRTFDEDVRSGIIDHMHAVLAGVCAGQHARYELTFSDYVPPIVNHPGPSKHVLTAAANILGEETIDDGPLMMVAEDMAEFLNRVPGSYFMLGAKPDRESRPEPHHSPRFDIDERALPLGVAILAGTAMSYLSG